METSQTQQEATMTTEPQHEHEWLQQLVGEWTLEGEATMEPGRPPETIWATTASGANS